MIELKSISKSFPGKGRSTSVLENVSMAFPTGSVVGLLGGNGSGKSTLLRMIAGLIQPDSGILQIQGKVSWPIGFQGSFHPDLSGAENTRFIARIYRTNTDWMTRFVKDFSGLGVHYNLPFRSYSSGMRARLAFAVSVAVPFDTYLIDEITSVGDAAFRKKCEQTLDRLLERSGAIIVTHSMEFLRRSCQSGVVLHKGRLQHFPEIHEAIEAHLSNMGSYNSSHPAA